jgi:hypothetical protein
VAPRGQPQFFALQPPNTTLVSWKPASKIISWKKRSYTLPTVTIYKHWDASCSHHTVFSQDKKVTVYSTLHGITQDLSAGKSWDSPERVCHRGCTDLQSCQAYVYPLTKRIVRDLSATKLVAESKDCLTVVLIHISFIVWEL